MKSTHKKHRITLRQKMMVSIFMVYVLLTAYFLYYTMVNQHHIAEEEIINAARMKASLASVAISGYMLKKDKAFLKRFVGHALENKDIYYMRLLDPEGGVLAEGGLQRAPTVHEEKGRLIVQEIAERPKGLFHKSGHTFFIHRPILHGGKGVGEIHMEINTKEANRRLARVTHTGMAIIMITLLTGSILTYFLERRMRGSVKNLIETTRHMAEGDLAQRVKISVGDEVEELSKSINRMAQALAEKEKELKTYTEHLEELAQERTRKLQEAQVQIVHQEKMAALGQMAAGVAHEIGNPLSALSSSVRSLEKDLRDNHGDGKKITPMKEQIDRISKIVREMTDFSRPASYQRSLTDGNQVIQSALGISSYDRRLKGIHVITRLDKEIPALKVDGDQLMQVFLNIIFNAADAMDGEGTLTVTSYLQNGSVIVRFEDTGPGIPNQLLSRVFEPFFTTKEVREGTGLGLSVSYGIVQGMGGEIRASNGKEGGAVFRVEIPQEYSSEGTG
jgi:signal transduction histidine kinase